MTLKRLAALALTVAPFAAAYACQSSSFTGEANKGATKANPDKSAGSPGEGTGTPGGPSGGTSGSPGDSTTGLGNPGSPGATGQGTDLGNTAGGLTGNTMQGGTGVDLGTGSGTKDGGGLLIDNGGFPCLPSVPALNVMFALDVTGSMDDEIAAVKDNVAQFAAALKTMPIAGSTQKITSVQIGAVTYVDSPGDNHVINMTDPSAFQMQVANEGIRGGIHDHCEGGLGAAGIALNMLAAAQTSDAVLPVLIVVSDNYSHDETQPEGSRSFNSVPLQQAAQNPVLKNLLLFDSVPTSPAVPTFTECPGVDFSQPPSAQWEPIRQAWKAAHPTAVTSPGRNVGFPFSQSTIAELPTELAKLIKVCKP